MPPGYMTQRMRRFCAFVTGFTFFASGILKLIDPVGAGLVMSEYFRFMHIGFLEILSKPAGTAMAFAETIIGAALVTGVWRKVTAIAAISFMGLFTLLSLALVIFNPDMDCGCFGEAIHLTHMQTFLKNIVLCALLAGAFIPFRDLGKPKARKYVSFGITSVSAMAFTVYSLLYVPPVDFTGYSSGTMIQSAAAFRSGEEIYDAVFIYEKDGMRRSFSLDGLPDSTWTFISTETEAKENPDENYAVLSFYDSDGISRDADAADGKVMAIIVHDPKMREKRWLRIMGFAENAERAGFRVLTLAASDPSVIDTQLGGVSPELRNRIKEHIMYSDRKTLITANRSNGGAIYVSDGMISGKWAYLSLPDMGHLDRIFAEEAGEIMAGRSTRGSLAFQGFMLYVCAVMLLL